MIFSQKYSFLCTVFQNKNRAAISCINIVCERIDTKEYVNLSQFFGQFYPSNANNSDLIATEDGSQNFVTICSTELSNATLWLVVDEMNVVVVGGNSQLSFPSVRWPSLGCCWSVFEGHHSGPEKPCQHHYENFLET